jgi:ribonuclease Z
MSGLDRRSFLRNLAAGAGALAAGGMLMKGGTAARAAAARAKVLSAVSGGEPLDTFTPPEELADGEMRVSILGSNYIASIGQAANSVFVELGNANRDCFVFDCGSGVMAKYVAMGVPFSRMTKVFLTHLHGDHMSDLTYIYCFGPSVDRKTDLHVFGPSGPHGHQGTKSFCKALHAMTRWHRDSFSFLTTGLTNGQDGYNLVAHQLPYREEGIAYESGDVKITHFPAIHARDGAISYKLEWGGPGGVSMVFTGDTKPNDWVLKHGQGVDLLIHEVCTSPELWTTHMSGLTDEDGQAWLDAVAWTQSVQDSSHTPAAALGYILSQTQPRLGVGTHYQFSPDCVDQITADVSARYAGPWTLSLDLMVFNVSLNKSVPIRQRMAIGDEYG